MSTKRNNKGDVVSGRGSDLTDLQQQFLERVAGEGMDASAKIARDLNYTSYYRDRRNNGTAFYKELLTLANAEMKSIDAAKGTNLGALIRIRDLALADGDMKAAMESIKIINDMQGYKAPTKVHQTKLDIKATIDLSEPYEDQDYLDVDIVDNPS
jgi:hypothetical protein|tara:strand:+ start:913 stop:1377 length:465 start_codon:yes stop_codon:yes gene_type:complete